MMEKAVGYIRVSSKTQVEEGESLVDQEQSIQTYAKAHGWALERIYRDEGISGSSMNKRQGLRDLMRDAQDGKFSIVLVKRITRFGRSLPDAVSNFYTLKKHNVKLMSIAEGLDFSSSVGQVIFAVLAGFAQMENTARAEQSLDGKHQTALKGHPFGHPPYARSYDRVTEKWSLDEKKAGVLRRIAFEFINGKPISRLARENKIDNSHLRFLLRERLGDEYEIKFKGSGETFTYKIPPIVEDNVIIEEIRAKLRKQAEGCKRVDVKKYPLNGFLKCAGCGRPLFGQTQRGRWVYYQHPNGFLADGQPIKCGTADYIPAEIIERAVFKTLFENVMDEVGFEAAIQEAFPKEGEKEQLQESINAYRAELEEVESNLEILLDLVLEKELIDRATIKKREGELLEKRAMLEKNIAFNQERLSNMPDRQFLEEEAHIMRRRLMLYYQSEERMYSMSYDEKRRFLTWLFDGEGLGIFITQIRKDRRNSVYEYRINARLFEGARFLRGDDFDYWDQELERLIDERIKKYKTLRDNKHYAPGGGMPEREHHQGRLRPRERDAHHRIGVYQR